MLAFRFKFLVVPYERVSGMFAGHQHTTRWCAHGVAGVVGGKPHAFARELVQVRGLDFLLPVGTQFRPAEIVGHDKNDVWFIRRQQRRRQRKQQECNEPSHGVTAVCQNGRGLQSIHFPFHNAVNWTLASAVRLAWRSWAMALRRGARVASRLRRR